MVGDFLGCEPLVDAYYLNRVGMDAVQQGSVDIDT